MLMCFYINYQESRLSLSFVLMDINTLVIPISHQNKTDNEVISTRDIFVC